MSIFQPPDDPAYLAWLDANPNGYVINTERGGRQYVMLHCHRRHGTRTMSRYRKLRTARAWPAAAAQPFHALAYHGPFE
jgi:hypothetical protein